MCLLVDLGLRNVLRIRRTCYRRRRKRRDARTHPYWLTSSRNRRDRLTYRVCPSPKNLSKWPGRSFLRAITSPKSSPTPQRPSEPKYTKFYRNVELGGLAYCEKYWARNRLPYKEANIFAAVRAHPALSGVGELLRPRREAVNMFPDALHEGSKATPPRTPFLAPKMGESP